VYLVRRGGQQEPVICQGAAHYIQQNSGVHDFPELFLGREMKKDSSEAMEERSGGQNVVKQ
jgi:hypothetical protein